MLTDQRLTLKTCSTGWEHNLIAPLNMPRTCSAWPLTHTTTSRLAYTHIRTFVFTSSPVDNSNPAFVTALQGLYSSVTCPGFVMTGLTYGILPSLPAFLWTLLMPVFWLVSAHVTQQNRSTLSLCCGGVKRKTGTMSLSLLRSQIRILTNTFTLTPYNGAAALVGKPFFVTSIHILIGIR